MQRQHLERLSEASERSEVSRATGCAGEPASVRGNGSLAAAGPGSNSRARVIANNSSALARDGARVTVRRNNVDPPRGSEETATK